MLVGRMSDCLRGGYVCRQLVCMAAIFLCLISSVSAQVVNGDFSAGGTGWTTVVPGTTDSIVFTGGTMVATSNNIAGGGAGPDITTLAQQTFTAGDPGFLSYTLVSYTTTDVGDFDHPVAVIDGTRFRVATDGSLVLAAPPPLINNTNPFTTPPLSGVTTLAAGSRTIAFGVRATDSILGSGIATWDDIDFQEITLSPVAQTTNENIPLTLSGVNAPQTATNTTDTITVTLSVSDGIINLGSPGSVTITGGADGTATVTFQGTPAQINTAMNGLIYTPDLGFEGDDTLVYTASAAPSGISDTDNITITVVPGNPSISVVKSALPTANLLAGQTW